MGSEVLVRVSALMLVSTASPGESGSKILKCSLISAFKASFADLGCFASNKRCSFRDFFARRGDLIPRSFFLSIRAFKVLRLSSPIMPSNDFSPRRTKKVKTVSFPIGLKNFPAIRRVILILPPAD